MASILLPSRLMHHTYEEMEARGWIQGELSPQCKVLADTLHCVTLTSAVHNRSAHSHAVCLMNDFSFLMMQFAYIFNLTMGELFFKYIALCLTAAQ